MPPCSLSVIPDRWRHDCSWPARPTISSTPGSRPTAFAFLLNAVPIERQRVSRDSANRVARLLQDGWSMLIFPEGGRSPDGWGQPHRAGAAWLAVRTGTPIVPVHVEGTRDILAKGSRRIRPGTSRVTFGRPLASRARERPPAARRSAGAGHRSPRRRSGHRLVDGPAAGRGADVSDSDRA